VSADVLSDVLRAVRLTGAVYFDFELSSPWVAEAPPSREIAATVMPGAERVIEYHLIARGACWGQVVGQEPIRLNEGDFIVFPQGDAHTLSSAPGMRATPDMSVFARPTTTLPIVYELGGGGPDRTRIVCCFLGCDERPFNPLLAALPRVIHLSAAAHDGATGWLATLLNIAVRESGSARAGSENVLARLSELMFVEALRRHLEALPPTQTGWLAGLRDAVVGQALEPRFTPTHSTNGPSSAWRDLPACRVPCWRSDSPRWWASRRCSISPCGACSSPRDCLRKAVRSRPSPRPSAMSRKRRSAGHSRSSLARLRGHGVEKRFPLRARRANDPLAKE
jgi:hypothetical protein